MSTVEAWHFLRDDNCLQFAPYTKVEVGQTLVFDGEPVLCEQGYHASLRAIDALRYAPGAIICRARMGGTIVHGDDKLVATERTVLWMADATNTLHECACQFAEEALRGVKVDDPRSHAAIDAKRKWVRGEITDAELAAARDAAWVAAAAAAAARDAAWAAAAAAAAARDVAWVARDAAAAAWDAAWVAAAAAAAAWDVAWVARDAAAAAWDAQNTILERELMKLGGTA